MFNSEGVIEFSEFTYWFEWKSDDEWRVFVADSGAYVGVYVPSKKLVRNAPDGIVFKEVEDQFKMFSRGRPEYWVGNLSLLKDNMDDMATAYESLLVGCALIRAKKRGLPGTVDRAISPICRCLDWLRSTDFFVAPASTQYHDSYPGGLLCHTLSVVENIVKLHSIDKFSTVLIEDAVLVALVHDWCKIGLYEKYEKNVKDENGRWTTQAAYKHRGEAVPLGHGTESMFLASRFFGLSEEEACAIRWHMGEYNVANNEMNALHRANETYPMVFMIQFADRLSITNY